MMSEQVVFVERLHVFLADELVVSARRAPGRLGAGQAGMG
jgi:hypothetical protein